MIPQQIIELVNLALRDGILTFRERQTIVAEAEKLGISNNEINEFLDNSLKSKISKMERASLKHCPDCGGQIPLISDNCPFCGHVFETEETSISNSKAAQIINQENVNTQEAAKNINSCPDCGAPFPILGNVCTHCGHILHEGQYSVFNIKNLISSMRESIVGMNKCTVSTFEMIKHRRYIYFAEISFLLFIAFGNFQLPSIFSIVDVVLFILAITSYRKLSKQTDSPVEAADREYYQKRAESEKYNRHIDALYGKNKEAQFVLKDFNKALSDVETIRKKNRGVIILVNAVLISLLFAMIFVAGNNQNMLLGNKKNYVQAYTSTERKVPVEFGIMDTKTGKLYKDQTTIKYLETDGSAVLTISNRSKNHGLVRSEDSSYYLCLNNVHIKSSGIKCNSLTDTMCLVAQFFDKDGKFIKAPSLLMDEEYHSPNHYYHKLPNGEKLDFRNIIKNGKYEYYANFRTKKFGESQLDSVNNFMDRAYSFMLFLK